MQIPAQRFQNGYAAEEQSGKVLPAATRSYSRQRLPQKNSPASVTRGSKIADEKTRNKQMVAQWMVNGVDQNNISNELVIRA